MKKYFKFLTLAAVVVSMSSCLKDDSSEDGTTGLNVDNQVFVQLSGASQAGRSNSVALAFEDVTVTPIFVTARFLSVNPAPEDIVITLDTTGQAAVLLPTGIVKLPNSFYTLPAGGLTITIPKGSNEGTLKITTNAIQFDPSTTYGLAFKIASVSPAKYAVAANYNTYYTTIGAKNKYDGKYQMTGYHNRVPFTFRYDQEMGMVTTSGTNVRYFWYLAGDFGHPIQTATGVSWYGPTIGPEVVFDPVTNQVTNVFNAGGSTTITLFTGPGSFPSRWEPSTKNMYVCWNYANNPLRAFFDTLIYKGSR
jgi:hypothetical protein